MSPPNREPDGEPSGSPKRMLAKAFAVIARPHLWWGRGNLIVLVHYEVPSLRGLDGVGNIGEVPIDNSRPEAENDRDDAARCGNSFPQEDCQRVKYSRLAWRHPAPTWGVLSTDGGRHGSKRHGGA